METDDRPAEPVLSEGARTALGEAVRRFDPLDRAILESRLGLHGRRRQPLPEVAAAFGVLPIKVRLVDGELTIRLRTADPGLMREYVEFLIAADKRDGTGNGNGSGGRRSGGRRRGRDAWRGDAGLDPAGAERGRGRPTPDLPDKGALAPILPGLSRTQVLIADELYGLVSGTAAPPAAVATRLGVTEGEVRRVDRMLRRLVKTQVSKASAEGTGTASRELPFGGDGAGLVGALDRAVGTGEADAPTTGS